MAFDIGLKNCAWRDDLYRRVVQSFIRQHAEGAKQILSALARGDETQMLHMAHSMKPSAAVVGAALLDELSGRLQEQLRTGQRPALAATAAALAREHAQVVAALAAFLDRPPAVVQA